MVIALQVVRMSSPGSKPRQFYPSLPIPGPVSQFPWKNFPTVSAEEFYYRFYYNEGLENKLTRAPLLGLAKSIYYDSQISVPAAFPSSTIVQFVYPWPVIDTLRLTNISQFFSTPTIDKFKNLAEKNFVEVFDGYKQNLIAQCARAYLY